MSAEFATSSSATLPLHVLSEAALEGWLADQPGPVQAWVKASGFAGALGQALLVPGEEGTPALALAG
ncbi:MAG TPA: leucyl aminopeptidase, partial [Sulfitobacter sp.]|nr:leucyl aminopeptidase [Sulfitobacter sp.]